MPRAWFDFHANALGENPTDEDVRKREMNLRILAEKKPYFMRYIYPPLMKDYNTYIKNTNAKCLMEFRMDLNTLAAMPDEALTEQQRDFLRYYRHRMPVGTNDCVMNKICRRFEEAFDGFLKRGAPKEAFDPALFKSDAEYTKAQYYAVKKLYDQYNAAARERIAREAKVREQKRADESAMANFKKYFTEECLNICSNGEVLLNILVDMCYGQVGTMEFVWDVCPNEIIRNLVKQNDGWISYPVRCDEGDIEYRGQNFVMERRLSAFAGDCAGREGMDGEGAEGDDVGEESIGNIAEDSEVLS